MSWCAVDVRSPEGARAAIASWLVGRTGQAVEERDDGTLVSFSETESAARELLLELQHTFAGVEGCARPLPRVDWSARWKEGLGPRTIGRLVITPSWTAGTVPAGPLTLVIDPETAFGTGEHGSTRAALALLDRHLVPGATVLDLGSGSGILAIAAVLLGARHATGIDNDEDAEPIARENARRNGVEDRARFVTGDATVLAPLLGPAGLVVSNILRSVNLALLPIIHSVLPAGGLAIFSGMEREERKPFLPELQRAGFERGDELVDDGWWGVAARRV